MHDKLDASAWNMQLKGTWNEFTGSLKQIWGDLTDNDLDVAEGKFEEIAGRIQRKTGESLETVHRKMMELTNR